MNASTQTEPIETGPTQTTNDESLFARYQEVSAELATRTQQFRELRVNLVVWWQTWWQNRGRLGVLTVAIAIAEYVRLRLELAAIRRQLLKSE